MLDIQNLHASVAGKEILKGLSLSIGEGEIHAIMGPNGSGKSTLAKVLAGHPDYEATSGTVNFEINMRPKSLLDMTPEDRARHGLFLGFQYPVEIHGVANRVFLRAALNAICKHQGAKEVSEEDFDKLLREKCKMLGMEEGMQDKFVEREVNVSLSGGEKKRNEILQMAILKPRLAFLDETDSGLDVDSLKQVAAGIQKVKEKGTSIVLVTHYQRLLDYIVPDFVHVLHQGRIIKSGDRHLALEIEAKGYDWLLKDDTKDAP
jgi:Fe-S cluster assembly ATP-binding protein